MAGRVECLQTCYFPAQKRACKDHSCWVTPEFISQLIKEASFSPSFPFLLCISGVVHRHTRPGFVQLALAWRVGRSRRRAMHTNTYFRRVVLVGPGWAPVGILATGAAKLAFRTQGLIIPLSHEACSVLHRPPGKWRPRSCQGLESSSPSTSPALGLEPTGADSVSP